MLTAGDVLGNYQIVCPLGRGSMGVLYVAEHRLIGRRVAIKVIAAEIAQHPEALTLFFREARAANQIEHPNIIQITDLIEATADTPTFLVMELLDGYTLSEVLAQENRLLPRRTAEIGARIADAMAAAHRVGVIHRDLKPDNIFLCVDEGARVKILDFGIAHLSGNSPDTELPCGTPLYISPEQAGADSFDERADIYSLGALLYEAVAGRPVFDYEGVRELFVAHVAEAPIPLGLPRGPAAALEAVIMACLEKSADERPLSMQVIADHLLDIASNWTTWSTDGDQEPEIAILDDEEFTRRLDELWSESEPTDDVSRDAGPNDVIVVEHSCALALPPEEIEDLSSEATELLTDVDTGALAAVLDGLADEISIEIAYDPLAEVAGEIVLDVLSQVTGEIDLNALEPLAGPAKARGRFPSDTEPSIIIVDELSGAA